MSIIRNTRALVALLAAVSTTAAPFVAQAQGAPQSSGGRAYALVHAQVDHLGSKGILIAAINQAIKVEINRRGQDVIASETLDRPVADPNIPEVGKSQLDQAERLFIEGRAAYQALDLLKARDALQRARGILYENRIYLDDPARLSIVLFYLALIAFSQGDEKGVDKQFEELALADESFTPDVALAPPVVTKRLDAQRQKIRLLSRTDLTVRTENEGAEVFLNGKFLGRTPLTATVRQKPCADGRHALIVAQPGFKSWRDFIDIRPEKHTEDVRLERSDRPPYRQRLAQALYLEDGLDDAVESARAAGNVAGAAMTYLWTLHTEGADELLVIGRVPPLGGEARVVAGTITGGLTEAVQPIVAEVFEILDRAGPALLPTAETALPASVDFKSNLLGWRPLPGVQVATGGGGSSDSVVTKWWFWTAIGGVLAVGGGIAAAILLQPADKVVEVKGDPELVVEGQVVR